MLDVDLSIILERNTAYHALIKQAVSDGTVSHQLVEFLERMLDKVDDDERLLLVRCAGDLGHRGFFERVRPRLLACLAKSDDLPDWCREALHHAVRLMSPFCPDREAMLRACLDRDEFIELGYRLADRSEGALIVPYVERLLMLFPSQIDAVAIKFALVWQKACLSLGAEMAMWSRIDDASRSQFLSTLEVYLVRVRRIRLWREIQLLISGQIQRTTGDSDAAFSPND